MKTTLRRSLFISTLPLASFCSAQTLTEATSIPAIGTVENRSYHQDRSASGLATSGTGNTWNAMGVTPFGITRTVIYRAPGDSPYAAIYPTTTICAEDNSGTPPAEWRHFHVTSSFAELLGANSEEFVGGRTYCTYPFSLGNTFTDDYTIAGNPYTDVVDYVASGEITAPWGTITNVVMFQTNGGPYTFYQASNMLDAIGSYMPGFGLDLWQVEVATGMTITPAPALGMWPVPAADMVHIALPFTGPHTVIVRDASGRIVHEGISADTQVDVDLRSLAPGIYAVSAVDARGRGAAGRLIVE